MDKDRRPLTPAMVAERWRCSERHVRNEIERGHLRHFKLGDKLIRIPNGSKTFPENGEGQR